MFAQSTTKSIARGLVRSTPFGQIEGKSWCHRTLAWLGVPYASPPVGELRWRAPRDPVPWQGVRRTTEFGSKCVQYGGLLLALEPETFGRPVGSEDCLYLNIWRPATDRTGLPVFVYLHGGLNCVGEAATSLYHGANLAAAANMVIVTINYRLGIFGSFAHASLTTGDPLDDSGNYGLLDIVQALRWVQRCIGAFGGDKRNVTLAGESAGAFNIGSLLASPLARGMFHRALSISPLTSMVSASMRRARGKADQQVTRLLVNQGLAGTEQRAAALMAHNGARWVAAHMRDCDAVDLLCATRPLATWGLNSLGLTIDTLGGGRFRDGAVLPKDFKGAYQRGEVLQVPYMVGSTSDEARIFELGLGVLARLSEREVCELIQAFDPDRPGVELRKILPRHRQAAYRFIGSFLGSRLFRKTGVDVCANALGRHEAVYVFEFSWDEQPTPFDMLIGASHMVPLPFLFGNFQTDRDALFRICWSESNRAGREQLSRAMMAYVGNFARSGDPNSGPYECSLRWRQWSPGERRRQRLVLDTPLSIRPA